MSVTFTSDRSEQVGLIDLFRDLLIKVGELFKIQLELTKTEARIEGRKLLLVTVWSTIFLTVGSFFLMFLGISMILLLAKVMSFALAAVVTTAFYLVLTLAAGLAIVYAIKRNSAKINV